MNDANDYGVILLCVKKISVGRQKEEITISTQFNYLHIENICD